MRLLALVAALVLAWGPRAAAQDYEIGPGDVVGVLVQGQDGLSGDFPVDAEGMMYYPFLGRVKASGMSLGELERKLATLLSDGYLRNPHVSATVKEYRSRQVFVTGEVQRPGAHGLRANGSLLLLLADVGGVTAEAGHEVVVIRPPKKLPEAPEPAATPSPQEEQPSPNATPTPEAAQETEEPAEEAPKEKEAEAEDEAIVPRLPGEVPGSQVLRVSLREVLSGNPEKDLPLAEGDTVYVPRTAQVFVTGHVVRPGAFRYEEGITVYEALTLAGGPTDRGSSKVRIVRLVDGKRREIKASMTDILLPGDTVKVPERFF